MVISTSFSSLFGKSPIKPIQQHMRVASNCAKSVIVLLEALCAGDQSKVQSTIDQINQLEHQADDIKNDLRAHLPKSLLMPVDRRDLLDILEIQDNIADVAQDVASLINLRPFEVHNKIRDQLLTLSRRCHDACEQAFNIIDTLDELIETGFGRIQSELVNDMVDELGRIESDTDEMCADLMRTLFSLEDELSPVSIMLWYELIGKISNLADLSEKVGNRVRLILAR